ncbi:MAG: DUF348 domain-containing protein [Anaerolineales bacterium]|nr:DUF348 domain-containing protein [Anaerolineales bacterium]
MKQLEKIPRHYLFLSAALLLLTGFVLLYSSTAKAVTISIDGQVIRARSHAKDIAGVLQAVGVHPSAGDRILPAPNSNVHDGDAIQIVRSGAVKIDLDGKLTSIRTAETSPANILAEAGHRLFPGDRVWVDGIWLPDPAQVLVQRPARIRVTRAMILALDVDGALQEIRSSAPTLGEALWEAGITIRVGDTLSPGPESALQDVSHAVLRRGRPIVIEVDGGEIETLAAGPSVGQVLAQAGVPLVGLDFSLPDVHDPIPEDGRIRVVRVSEEVLVEMEPRPFDTVYQPAPDLELDTLRVVDLGTYGVNASRIRIRKENGEEVNRIVEETWEAVDPSPRVVGYGTKVVVRTMSTPDGPLEYWRVVRVYQTSYSPCNQGVPGCGSITASGKRVKHGMIAVIRSWFLMMRGWPVYVPNYGVATIEDVGGGISGRHWIDLAYTDEEYEIRYGWTTLYFLTPVPPIDQIPWILP